MPLSATQYQYSTNRNAKNMGDYSRSLAISPFGKAVSFLFPSNYSLHVRIFYSSPDIARYWSNIANFSYPTRTWFGAQIWNDSIGMSLRI